MPATRVSTRERIVSAASRQFAEQGFNEGSLRRITGAARANVAAVNYHFGSKEDLYREVLLPRLRAINRERIARLAQAEQLSGDQPVPLPAVLESFVDPFLRPAANPATDGRSYLRLVSRALIHPPRFLREELARELDPVWVRFTQCLAQILPGIAATELRRRLELAAGTMLVAAARHGKGLPDSAGASPGEEDYDVLVRRLVRFCAAGIAAS